MFVIVALRRLKTWSQPRLHGEIEMLSQSVCMCVYVWCGKYPNKLV